jgi:hypothetical protein
MSCDKTNVSEECVVCVFTYLKEAGGHSEVLVNTKQHGVTFQKTVLFLITPVRI